MTNYFCNEGNPTLSFTEATVYAPLILISILYLPTLVYIIFEGIQFYGLKNCINEIINDPVYFIFPIFTSFSFYEMSKFNCQENCEKSELSVPQNDPPSKSKKVDTNTEQHGDLVNIDEDLIGKMKLLMASCHGRAAGKMGLKRYLNMAGTRWWPKLAEIRGIL